MSQADSDSLVAVTTLSFDEVKDRVMDNLYYYTKQIYADAYDVDVAVTKVELVSAYINTPDDLDSVMVVPAWEVQSESVASESGGETIELASPPVFVSAIDGSLIATPTIESSGGQ